MIARGKAQRLAVSAHEAGAEVLRGPLRNMGSRGWRLGDVELTKWLADYEGQEVFLIVAPIAERREPALKTCRTCGRDYEGRACPHCEEVRKRLRGR